MHTQKLYIYFFLLLPSFLGGTVQCDAEQTCCTCDIQRSDRLALGVLTVNPCVLDDLFENHLGQVAAILQDARGDALAATTSGKPLENTIACQVMVCTSTCAKSNGFSIAKLAA